MAQTVRHLAVVVKVEVEGRDMILVSQWASRSICTLLGYLTHNSMKKICEEEVLGIVV